MTKDEHLGSHLKFETNLAVFLVSFLFENPLLALMVLRMVATVYLQEPS